MKKFKLETIVFLSGAISMGLEIVAARVLSPYVGNSNIVWTSIIGVILISMSIGYWIGGKRADSGADENTISSILLYSAVATSLISLLETVIVNKVAENIGSLIISAILCAIAVFSIPSFLLAMISPIAVKIKINEKNNIGKTSGKISSLSTIGSIIGTFLMGFILIRHIGVFNINIGVTVILTIMSAIIIKKIDKKYIYKTIMLVSIMGIAIVLGKYLFKIKHPDILLDTDSQYSRIWVKEIETQKTTYKTLQVDRALESYIDSETGEMGAKYLRYYDLFDYFNKDAKSTLMIGGAAYTYPMHYLQKYKDKTIDVVEIDNKMTQIAKEQFGLDTSNPNLKIVDQDGRTYLNYSSKKYDTILLDAFKGLTAPFELTTFEAVLNAKKMLNDNGMLITNIISSLEGKESKFIKYEYATYKAVFEEVKLFEMEHRDPNIGQNLILVGIKGKPVKDETKYAQYKQYLDLEVADYNSDKRIVTDDYAPIGD